MGPGVECDPYEQDCPDGEKCNAWSDDGGGAWNALGCFPVDPAPGQPGDPCTVEGGGTSGIDSCDVGSMCWDVEEDSDNGTCVAMCEGSAVEPTCSVPETSCVISNGGILNLCLPNCDLLLQDCPNEGEACYVVGENAVCAPDASDDGGGAGDECAFINACDPGLTCIVPDAYGPGCNPVATACCSPWCDLDAPAPCPELGQTCLPFFEEDPPPGLENLGVCGVEA